MTAIVHPFVPAGRTYEYVPMSHQWMRHARETAQLSSFQDGWPVGAVITAPDGMPVTIGTTTIVMAHGAGEGLVSAGANGHDYHERHGCDRRRLGIPSGQDYLRCEGCHPDYHAEARAFAAAHAVGIIDLRGYHLYLWGHWFCCEHCSARIVEAGIARVFLLEGSEQLFNADHPGNVIGRQFIYDKD